MDVGWKNAPTYVDDGTGTAAGFNLTGVTWDSFFYDDPSCFGFTQAHFHDGACTQTFCDSSFEGCFIQAAWFAGSIGGTTVKGGHACCGDGDCASGACQADHTCAP